MQIYIYSSVCKFGNRQVLGVPPYQQTHECCLAQKNYPEGQLAKFGNNDLGSQFAKFETNVHPFLLVLNNKLECLQKK